MLTRTGAAIGSKRYPGAGAVRVLRAAKKTNLDTHILFGNI
jgi:hypothetical protein